MNLTEIEEVCVEKVRSGEMMFISRKEYEGLIHSIKKLQDKK